jgi:hemolysin III
MYHGERFNSSTHLMGTVLAAAGAAVLVVLAARQGDPWKIVSFSIYGAMLLLLYTLSTLYHLFVLAGSASHYLALLLYVA